jgi:hypothetical protein
MGFDSFRGRRDPKARRGSPAGRLRWRMPAPGEVVLYERGKGLQTVARLR